MACFSDGFKCFFVKFIDTCLPLSKAFSRLSLIEDVVIHQMQSSRDDQMDCHCRGDLLIFLQQYESFFSHHYQTASTLHVCLNDKYLLLFCVFFWHLNTLSRTVKEYLAVTGL